MGRFNIEFSDVASRNIDELAKRRGLTRFGLVQRALAVYTAIVENGGVEGEVLIRRADGEQRIVGI